MAPRFSPPKDKFDLIKSLAESGSPFNEYRDVLFFAAVLGWQGGRRVPLSGRGETIRWEVFRNRTGTELITDMIAVACAPDDPSILAASRLDERVAMLEEYANGGLELLQERINKAGAVSLETLFIHMIQQALAEAGDDKPTDLAAEILNL
jgi:dnd system-associated protein 4